MHDVGRLEEIELIKIFASIHYTRQHSYEMYIPLRESIREIGLRTPLTVCPSNVEGFFELVTGFSRFEACTELELKKALCHVITREAAMALLSFQLLQGR